MATAKSWATGDLSSVDEADEGPTLRTPHHRNIVRMGLVAEIQRDAVNPDSRTSDILRKCMILAGRLGHEPFTAWVRSELGGYSDTELLPSYRACEQVRVLASISGPFQARESGVDVPYAAIPDDVRDWATTICYRQSVAELEDLVSGQSHLSRPLPANLALRTEIFQGWTTTAIWQDVSRSKLAGVLDAVRNGVLNFVLEIEQENPDAGEAKPGTQPIPEPQVAQIFNTYVLGGVAAVGNDVVQSVVQTAQISVGDLDSLRNYLLQMGLDAEDLQNLEAVLIEDSGFHESKRQLGEKTEGWLRRVASKVGAAAGAVGANAGGGLIAAALVRYLGW